MGVPVLLRVNPRVLFIDDDEEYLDALDTTIPVLFNPSFFPHPSGIDKALEDHLLLIRREQMYFAPFKRDAGVSLIHQALMYFEDPIGREIVSVLVSDYFMPSENGVSLCSRFRLEGLRRVLLTGAADSDLAISAFNAGNIEVFLPKQTTSLLQRLVSVITEQIERSLVVRGKAIESSFTAEALAFYMSPEVYPALMRLLDKHHIKEFIFLGQPLGFVGITDKGRSVWVQIEDEGSIRDLASTLLEMEWTQENVSKVLRRESLVCLDLSAQIEGVDLRLEPLTVVCQEPFVAAAVFEINVPVTRMLPASQSSFGELC
jgi:CheY-like chemotaxis protein